MKFPGRGLCPDCNRPVPWPCKGNCGGSFMRRLMFWRF